MYIYKFTCVYVYIYINIYTCTYIYINVTYIIHTHTKTHTYIQTYIHTYIHGCLCACVCVKMFFDTFFIVVQDHSLSLSHQKIKHNCHIQDRRCLKIAS
jgi:hypothetical protein